MQESNQAWIKLQRRIIRCRRCTRLAVYIREVAKIKVRRYKNQKYWGKPIPGFGDVNARLLILGLAPAAHGGNRTGRMFTGDSSGNWLIKALYESGFANQPESESRDDGLALRDAFITAPVRCAPPGNRPSREEIQNCSQHLIAERHLLPNIQVVLALGRIAFDVCLRYLYPHVKPKLKFNHGAEYYFQGLPLLVVSFHPSRQNTQTGRLSWESWIKVFQRITMHLEKNPR
ncbi:MAG: uracil-DNA glycosylase [Promethearchaeota archaeon]